MIPVTDSSDFLVIPVSSSYRIEVLCDTNSPKSVQKWRSEFGASMAFNAGFFDAESVPVGYTKTAEKTWGSPSHHPAYFAVSQKNSLSIISSDEHFQDDLLYATSGFPLLIQNGENRFEKESKKYDRRTIVAQKNDRLLFFVSIRGYPSLAESALALEEFGVQNALNLDGGTSTGFSSVHREIYSVPVPCAILVFDSL